MIARKELRREQEAATKIKVRKFCVKTRAYTHAFTCGLVRCISIPPGCAGWDERFSGSQGIQAT